MGQDAEDAEARMRALLDEARQDDRRHLNDLLKQRDVLIRQELQQQKNYMQQLLKDQQQHQQQLLKDQQQQQQQLFKDQMTQMLFQMQQLFLTTPQNLANPPPLVDPNNINANPGNPIPAPAASGQGAVNVHNVISGAVMSNNTTPPPGSCPPPPAFTITSVNAATQQIASLMNTPVSASQVGAQHPAQNSGQNQLLAAASMLGPNYLLAATDTTGTTPISTVQNPMSAAYTPLLSNNNTIAANQQSQAGSTSLRGRNRSRGPPGARSQTNRRNRRAVKHRWDPDDDDEGEYTDSDTGEENDGYDINRERPERPIYSSKSLHMDKFSGEKGQNFGVWVRQYEGGIKRCVNPHSKRRHQVYNLEWLPTMLQTEAYAIWEKTEHRSTDWEKLKVELELTFEDPTMRTEWRNNLRAYKWDEHNVPLKTYCVKVKRDVDTFDSEIAECPKALKAQYYLRFFNGLPEDYQGQVTLSLTAENQDIDKAMDVCLRFQAYKKNQKEVAAAVVMIDHPSIPSRVNTNKLELTRVKDQLKA